ncbi:hypothetical protein [Salisaeta longa]|uniref:hypothetical protein n=1 Tax=Salisaeta longa TaxID=503170 RepID=UPI0012FCF1A7|nr:hypothetical protein [Salisaeta longa]
MMCSSYAFAAAALDPSSPYLYATVRGTVLHCACCGRFQLIFDETVLLLSARDVRRLQRVVRAAVQANGASRPLRIGRAGTDAPPTCIPAADLAALHALLDGAAAMHELSTILRDMSVSTA